MNSKSVFCSVAAAMLFLSCSKVYVETSQDVVESGFCETSEKLISSTLISSTPVEEAVGKVLTEIEAKSGDFIGYEPAELDKFLDEIDLKEYGIDIELYRITYWSKDNFGNDVKLNGDVAFIHNPFNPGTRYLESVSLIHTALYTSSSKATHYERDLVPIRAIHNALVVHPLYQGSEIDKGQHDVIVSEQLVKAHQAIDCELAALEFIKQKEGVEMMPGYYTDNISISVGTGTALATHYLLEQDEEYSKANKSTIHLAGTCLCEGCYSFYSLLPVFMSDGYDLKNGVSNVKAYSLIATIVGSYDTWKGIDKGDGNKFYDGYEVEDFFSQKFLDTEAMNSHGDLQGKNLIEYYRAGDMDHFKNWKYEDLCPANMLAPEMYGPDGFIDETSPKSIALIEALKQNDIVLNGWNPRADICFCHSLDDDLISYDHAFETFLSLSHNGLNPNVKIRTIAGLGHDDSNMFFIVTHYLLKKHPAL